MNVRSPQTAGPPRAVTDSEQQMWAERYYSRLLQRGLGHEPSYDESVRDMQDALRRQLAIGTAR